MGRLPNDFQRVHMLLHDASSHRTGGGLLVHPSLFFLPFHSPLPRFAPNLPLCGKLLHLYIPRRHFKTFLIPARVWRVVTLPCIRITAAFNSSLSFFPFFLPLLVVPLLPFLHLFQDDTRIISIRECHRRWFYDFYSALPYSPSMQRAKILN